MCIRSGSLIGNCGCSRYRDAFESHCHDSSPKRSRGDKIGRENVELLLTIDGDDHQLDVNLHLSPIPSPVVMRVTLIPDLVER